MADNFVKKTLDTLLEVVEVEFKIPLGFAEIKLPVTDHAKKWWKNKKSKSQVELAIRRAEESFIAAHPGDKLAQILHGFPLYSEQEYKNVVIELLNHLDEERVIWLAEVKLEHQWDKLISKEEIRKALEIYLPHLRHELNGVTEFREIIVARAIERIDERTKKILDKTDVTVENTEKIKDKLEDIDKTLKAQTREFEVTKQKSLNTGWFYGHRYGDLESFTGRADELNMLNAWLNNDKDNLLMLRALGGFGKSALAWTWFNRIDREQWGTAVWWSFYEKESGFESFLSETLKHLGVEVKESARQQVNDLLEALRGTNILIVLDGFERLLRQYGRMDAALQSDDEDADIDPSQRDCSSPLTETFLRGLSGAGMRSKVLMTTRLPPRALESADGKLLKGCRDEVLSAFSPDDAVTYFHNEGIAATRAEIVAACSAYGYHPLSLSLLVGLINEDHEHRGDIVVARNLDIFGDIKAKRDHILKRAYESLAPERRDLLSKISCFRGSMEYAVLKKVFASPDLDKSLLDLRKRGLLQYAGETQRYDLHPIVRHYAYNHFTDEKRRKEAHVKLAMHFVDSMPVTNTKIKTLEDLAPVIELYHHMVRAGNLDEAQKLFHGRLHNTLYFQFGAYQLIIELLRVLFLDGEDKPPHLKKDDTQAFTIIALANSCSYNGQLRHAIPLFEMANDIYENKIKNKQFLAVGLGNIASQHLVIGALTIAERNLRKMMSLAKETEDEFRQARGHLDLGQILSYRGMWQDAEQELEEAQKVFDKYGAEQTNFVSVVRAYRSLRFLLMTREKIIRNQPPMESAKSAIEFAKHALELADETARTNMQVQHDYVDDYRLLGEAYLMNNDLTLAEENLSKALNLCRQINMVDHEADILLDLARLSFAYALRSASGSAQDELFKDAQEKASEALVITERSGYVLQGADVNLFLAQYTLEQEKDKAKAKEYAESTLKLAYCDGPPYYYKVAYEEAEAMLERLK